jgi:fatty-acid peroxygenase
MLENTGRFGPRNWRALLLRRRTEQFVRSLVNRVRAGRLKPPETAPLRIVAGHREENGKLLDADSAAVEIINLLRPIVAVGRYVMFAAMSLARHPEWRARFAVGDESSLEPFAEEVRRLYPFFPIIGGLAREAFTWQGYSFRKGDWVLLDLYGTNHDAGRFPSPNKFSPGRDISWKTQGFDFIPHGGGNAAVSHRCPGEAITLELMKEAIRLLSRDMSYEVPEQDLTLDLSHIPVKPKGGLRIGRVRRAMAAD